MMRPSRSTLTVLAPCLLGVRLPITRTGGRSWRDSTSGISLWIPMKSRFPKASARSQPVSLQQRVIHRGPGRPRNTRVKYHALHLTAKSAHWILCSQGHRNLPNFVGRWFPRSDSGETRAFYCACVLALLKPWCNLGNDLKQSSQTWEEAFVDFF